MATRLELLNVRIEDTKMLHCSKKKKKKSNMFYLAGISAT